jgi:hypothetical protein
MGILDNLLTPDTFDNLALGFNSMRLNPDQNLPDMIARRQALRREAGNRQKAIDYFKNIPGSEAYIGALNAGGSGANLISNHIATLEQRKRDELAHKRAMALAAANRAPQGTVEMTTMGALQEAGLMPKGVVVPPAMMNMPVKVTKRNNQVVGLDPIQMPTAAKNPAINRQMTGAELAQNLMGTGSKSTAALVGKTPNKVFDVTIDNGTITNYTPATVTPDANKTVTVLKNLGRDDLATLVENGVLDAASAVKEAYDGGKGGATDQTEADVTRYPNGYSVQLFKSGRTVHDVPTKTPDGKPTLERIVIEADGSSTTPDAQNKIAAALAEAQQAEIDQKIALKRAESDTETITGARDEALEKLRNIDSQSGSLYAALQALDNGAKSGYIERYLPAFDAATASLREAANRLGLDIVSATTFGALSKGELDLSLRTALDINLPEAELRVLINNKIQAIEKTRNELLNAVLYLSAPGATVEEYTKNFIVKSSDTSQSRSETESDINTLQDALNKMKGK